MLLVLGLWVLGVGLFMVVNSVGFEFDSFRLFCFCGLYGRCCLPFDRCALQWYFVFDLCGLFCLGLDDLWCLRFDCFFVRALIMLL